ncbi:MAG: MFS transporter [Candidatus Omnitrophica bacterium]|nr:MFS transporter [Candidatus Omnitrophota bacterium]
MLVNWGVARLAAVVYFVQGSLGIAGIAFPLYLRAQGFSIARITFITSVSAAPWFLKIIYGAVSDAIPIGGLRRKPYLIIFSLCSCLGWILLGLFKPQETYIIFAMMVANLGFAATDVITDGLVVEYSRSGSAQTYQSISWGARGLGSVLSGFTGGLLAAQMQAQHVFMLTALLPLISLSAVFSLREKLAKRSEIPENVIAPIIKSFRLIIQGELKWFLVFLFIISSSVAIGIPLFFYMRETLLFDEVALGLLNSVTWLGAIIGCFIFINFFRKAPLRQALYWAVGIGFLNILLTLLIHNYLSAFIISLLLGILGYNVLLPLFSSAAKLVHGSRVEGSLYAILMSLFNLGQALAGFLGGLLYERIGLQALIVLTAFLSLSAFFVIPRLKRL